MPRENPEQAPLTGPLTGWHVGPVADERFAVPEQAPLQHVATWANIPLPDPEWEQRIGELEERAIAARAQQIQQQIEPWPPMPEVLGAPEDQNEDDEGDQIEPIWDPEFDGEAPKWQPAEQLQTMQSTPEEQELAIAEAKEKGFNNAIQTHQAGYTLTPRTDDEIYPARYALTEEGKKLRDATIEGYRLAEASLKKPKPKKHTLPLP